MPCSVYEKDGHPFEPLACMQSEEKEDIVFKHHENGTEGACKQMIQKILNELECTKKAI